MDETTLVKSADVSAGRRIPKLRNAQVSRVVFLMLT